MFSHLYRRHIRRPTLASEAKHNSEWMKLDTDNKIDIQAHIHQQPYQNRARIRERGRSEYIYIYIYMQPSCTLAPHGEPPVIGTHQHKRCSYQTCFPRRFLCVRHRATVDVDDKARRHPCRHRCRPGAIARILLMPESVSITAAMRPGWAVRIPARKQSGK